VWFETAGLCLLERTEHSILLEDTRKDSVCEVEAAKRSKDDIYFVIVLGFILQSVNIRLSLLFYLYC